MANTLQQVEAYMTGEAFPQLILEMDVLDIVDSRYNDWKNATECTRGETVKVQLPSRFVATDSLGFTTTNAGQNFNERAAALTIDQAAHTDFALTDKELATYDLENDGSLNVNVNSAISEVATKVNQFVTQSIALGGYRFGGNVFDASLNLRADANLDYKSTVRNVRQFYNFGGNAAAHYVIPSVAMAEITSTGLQQFVPKRNDDDSRDWSIGTLTGVSKKVNFYSSDLLPIHNAGSAAEEQTAGYSITNIDNTATYTYPGSTLTVPASRLSVSIATGLEVIEGDIFDIIPFDSTNDIRFLQFIGHNPSFSRPQALVVSGGTAAGDTLDVVVIPRLQRTSTVGDTVTDPNDNLTRPIDTTASAEDQIRFVKSHVAGFVMLDKYAKFAAPPLESTEPYTSYTAKSEDGGVSMRCYHGYVPENAVKGMVHEMIYGNLPVSEGIMRIPFPRDLLS